MKKLGFSRTRFYDRLKGIRWHSRLSILPSVFNLYNPEEIGVEPLLSAKAFNDLWHGRQQYTLDRLSKLVGGTEYESLSVVNISLNTAFNPEKCATFNHASYAYSNDYFLSCITQNPSAPYPDVLDRINTSFFSMEAFENTFVDVALAMYGSGFLWVVEDDEMKLKLVPTYNAGSPLLLGRSQILDQNTKSIAALNYPDRTIQPNEKDHKMYPYSPVLCCNLWEHAWLTDYGINGKQGYVENFLKVIDWARFRERVSQSLSKEQQGGTKDRSRIYDRPRFIHTRVS